MSAQEIATLKAEMIQAKENDRELKEKLDAVHADVKEIQTKLDRQKGFISGIVAATTFIWGVLAGVALLAWEWIKGRGDWP